MRLITRGDFDGLICAVLLSTAMPIERVLLTHAKDLNDNTVKINSNDVIANLPFMPKCKIWFDHHISEHSASKKIDHPGKFAFAPSCARVIADYFKNPSMFDPYAEVLAAADKIDAAQLSENDVLNPTGWVMISNTLQNYAAELNLMPFLNYFNQLTKWIKSKTLEEILGQKEVKKRIGAFVSEQNQFVETLKKNSYTNGNIVVTDMRKLNKPIYGNRFLIYTLYPEQNISINLFNKRGQNRTILACGHNIFKRDAQTNIGSLMKEYGGGGHVGAGTCHAPRKKADQLLEDLVKRMGEPV